jgi:hypothetical protein
MREEHRSSLTSGAICHAIQEHAADCAGDWEISRSRCSRGRLGHSKVAGFPEGEPMELVATGPEVRRGIVLVLRSSTKPHTTIVTNWHSTGLANWRSKSVERWIM